MDFKEIIRKNRDLYLNALIELYKENPSGAKEILLELNIDEPIRQFKLYRIDYFEKVNNESKPTELNLDKYLDFEQIEYNYGEMKIELNPFYWNGCEFILNEKPKEQDWLIEWIKGWIDEDDGNNEDSNGLSGVIHSVTRPKQSMHDYSFSVDFGSADLQSFLDLIDEIYLQGVKKLKIGSFSMIEKVTSA
jgi:hypothetical protein